MQPRHSAQLRLILSNMSPPHIRLEFLDRMHTILGNRLYHQYNVVLPGLRQWFMEKSAPKHWMLGIRSSSLFNHLIMFQQVAEQLNNIRQSIKQLSYYFHFRKWQLCVLSATFELAAIMFQTATSWPHQQHRDDYRGTTVMCVLCPLRIALFEKVETLRTSHSWNTTLRHHLQHQGNMISDVRHPEDCEHCKPHPHITCHCAAATHVLLTRHTRNYLASQVNINKFFGGLTGLHMEGQHVIILPSSGLPISKYLEWTRMYSHLGSQINE